jgi:hypothetical protein
MKKLLFFITDWAVEEKCVVSATLSWLSERRGWLYDNYIQKYVLTPPGGLPQTECAGPYFGAFHNEQFYYISNCFDIAYCSIGGRRFLRDLKAFSKREISIRKRGEIFKFYRDVFSFFDEPIPERAIMVETAPFKAGFGLDAYTFPEICGKRALGITSSVSNNTLQELRDMGLRIIETIFVADEKIGELEKMGFEIRTRKHPKDFESFTRWMADRWLKEAKGIAYADPVLAAFWLPFFVRKRILPLYSLNWKEFVPVLASYSTRVGNDLIWGRQTWDDLITELSRYGKVIQLIDNTRPAITVKDEINYPVSYVKPELDYWGKEIPNDVLIKDKRKDKIGVTFLLFANDVRHFTIIPRIFDLVKAQKVKIGLAITDAWYDYAPELLEDTLIPMESGGTFPFIELLVCSAGLGAATEAKGFLPKEKLLYFLKKARMNIVKKWGERLVPKGYYPWQDSSPYYKPESGEPQFDVIKEAGFEYYVTYKNGGRNPEVVYREDDFIVLNQQTVQWEKESPLRVIKEFENRINGPGFIIVGLDSPFYGFHPFYIDELKKLKDAMEYTKKGGKGRLFSATPHEIVKYTKLCEVQYKI